MSPTLPTERAIEKSFPIVQLNPLARHDQGSKRAIYQMHSWYARRSESTFRTILLSGALPADADGQKTDLMAEFYRGHRDDARLRRPDGAPLRVLDPFMGGGTTVVESLRLGLDVTGVDYNPIAWFIVKGETTPVDIDALDAAFQRISRKVRDDLLAMYQTACPLTGKPADIIYGFWVKQGICVDPSCKAVTDLFKSYVVGRKRGDASLRYVPDFKCPSCDGTFDWEIDRCTITAGGPQIGGNKPEGKSRPNGTGWAFARPGEDASCPHCAARVPTPVVVKKPKKKSVGLHVLVDPSTGDFFEVRGDIPDRVNAPRSGHAFAPGAGPADGGKFGCSRCGRTQDIVDSARAHGAPLPFRYYGFYAYTPHGTADVPAAARLGLPTNNDKWFGAAGAPDVGRITDAAAELERIRAELPIPDQEIYDGYNTNRLIIHQYGRWSDTYGKRQLLALGKLLRAIGEERDPVLRDALLGAFQNTLDFQSNLVRYNIGANKVEAVTAGHDYRNPTTTAETSPFGSKLKLGRGTFVNYVDAAKRGLAYQYHPTLVSDGLEEQPVDDVTSRNWRPNLLRGSANSLPMGSGTFDMVVTDPPYAGSVQYAEMSDWSYVWLHQALKDHYPDEFGPEITLKSQEIIEDDASKDAAFFFENLTLAWLECHRVLVDDGLLVFTFHHREGDRWTGLLRSLFEAGFYLVAAYPTHSEALNSIVIQATQGITYDIVHVCRKRLGEPDPIAWSRLRREVTREARVQLKEIELGNDPLPGADVQMILLGKALMLFSRHYGRVLDADGQPMNLDEAMERILVLVREVRGQELPLPGTLQDVDSLSQLALLHLVGRGPWLRDDLHKELHGYAHGPDTLLAAGLVRPMPGSKHELDAVPAVERGASGLSEKADRPLIDKLHVLLARVHGGQPIEALMKRWRGQWTVIVEALTWLGKADAAVRELTGLAAREIEALGPDVGPEGKAEQLGLFGGKQ